MKRSNVVTQGKERVIEAASSGERKRLCLILHATSLTSPGQFYEGPAINDMPKSARKWAPPKRVVSAAVEGAIYSPVKAHLLDLRVSSGGEARDKSGSRVTCTWRVV